MVEATIVLTVVSVGLSVGLPAYRDYRIRQEVDRIIQAATPAKALVEEYAAHHARLPDSTEVVLPFPAQAQVHSILWAGSSRQGAITITIAPPRSGVPSQSELAAKTIALGATYNPATKQVDWLCGGIRGTTVNARYLPTGCQGPV